MAEDSGLADGLRQITGKGPLEAGGVMALPSFEALLRQATDGTDLAATDEDSAPQLRAVESVELRVGFVYGPEAHPWGARRRFRVLSEEAAHGSYKFVPETLHTERYYSRRHRRKVRAWLEQCR